jgi:hypothetical protein
VNVNLFCSALRHSFFWHTAQPLLCAPPGGGPNREG